MVALHRIGARPSPNRHPAAAPGAASVLVKEWDAKKDFRGVDVPAQPALKPWEQLVQVLLSANEFSYVD